MPPTQKRTETLIEALRTAILSLDGPVFAVLDGAQFENLPQTLMFAGIEARCLYLDRGDNHPERLVTAPYMVGPLEGGTLDRVLSALPKTSAAVFWECPDGADALYRHLRGINMVRYPTTTASNGTTYDLVVFRHCDAEALHQVLSALSDQQTERFLGPSASVLYETFSGDDPGFRTIRGTGSRSTSAREPITVLPAQVDLIAAQRTIGANVRTLAFLRETLPPPLSAMEDEALCGHIRLARRSGSEMGIRSEAAHWRWAYMSIMSQHRAAEDERIASYIRYGGRGADDQVKLLMRHTVAALRARSSGAGSQN